MSYFDDYATELAIGSITFVSSGASLLVLHCANFKVRHIEIIIKRRWPRMPYPLVKVMYLAALVLLVVPLAVIIWLLVYTWEKAYYESYALSIGTGILLLMTYTTMVGFLSWRRSMWCLTWLEVVCSCLFAIEIIVFLYAYDFLDELFDYETHTIFFFVGSLVLMVLFMYALSARSGLCLDHLYRNFLRYYEQKLKDKPVQEVINIEVPVVQVGIPKVEEEVKKEEVKNESADGNSEVNAIDMSLIISKASMQSGEKSHIGNIPQIFPGESIPIIYADEPSLPADMRYKQEFREILGMTIGSAKTTDTVKCVITLVFVIGIYVFYNVGYVGSPDRSVYLVYGITQTLYVIYFDIIIILWSTSRLRKSSASITESTVLMLFCRIVLSLSLRYWVLCHCAIYLVLSSVISNSLCNY
eukprot:TRINITY_DN2320_c0_g3_i1.p1 TRINITY_DN2320_c0_g3~~TRINITY_DN2320_c0_g3_i1.p1  ORF type:complete len:414 (+),score=85.45 TRINITY_DN2320_c0_g3_i1:178-1419(+)